MQLASAAARPLWSRTQSGAGTGGWAIDLDDLQRAVTAAEPSAVLVPRRILRRVIRRDRGYRLFGGAASRQSSYAVLGLALGRVVSAAELGRPVGAPWPETVYLIARPEPDELAATPPDVLKLVAWRRLFRVRVREALRRSVDHAGLSRRIEAVGWIAFEEAGAVLRKDGRLFPEDDDLEVYAAFAAEFLELSAFAPALLASTFPAVEDTKALTALFAADVDPAALLLATRPAGAHDPCPVKPVDDEEPACEENATGTTEWTAGPRATASHDATPGDRERARRSLRRLATRAKDVAARGNNVRAALIWTKASGPPGSEEGEFERAEARSELKHLADRLQKALFIRKGEAELWADALNPLLCHAARGFVAPEARLLFDLQKVCLDHEREVFRLEPLRWLFSRGRKPLKRPLPHLREVAMSNHLRDAARRLATVRLTRDERRRLESLLRTAMHHAADALRERFRPRVEEALQATWVQPRGVAERVAYRKLVEEMLDRVASRGFSTLGDLRDAASQSNLKMPDLADPSEFFHGDRLLNADRALADQLDGVHRRGEVYLRWFQRLSAAAFGTPAGRFLTLYLALPYGGAFVALKGTEEIIMLGTGAVGWLRRQHHAAVHWHMVHPLSVILLGTVVLGAINSPTFRSACFATARGLGRGLHGVFIELPSWVVRNPLVQWLMRSSLALAIWRVGLKPALAALPVWFVAHALGVGPTGSFAAGVSAYVGWAFLFATEVGRTLEEVAVEEVGRAFRALTFDVIPGLFRMVQAAFEDLLGWVEKVIYAVDEWLRFRSGESAVVLALKAVLGLGWAVLAYLIRIYVNLLIEPQVNPIKHFPVVTVSHKVIAPLSIHLTVVLTAVLKPFLGEVLGMSVAAANVLLLPGVFGFLAWELKSNWRLYEANRPPGLSPVMVGSHGETVVGLLRPAFHSGTLPKQFARLRAARRAGRDRSALKRRAALHHVEEAVRRFVDREFAALLDESRSLDDANVHAGSIHLATNRIRVELVSQEIEGPGPTVDLEERAAGFLAADLARTGWLAEFEAEPRRRFEAALFGLFKMSGVERLQRTNSSDLNPGTAFGDREILWSEWAAYWELDAGAPVEPRAFELLEKLATRVDLPSEMPTSPAAG
jgi:hypothetical protein